MSISDLEDVMLSQSDDDLKHVADNFPAFGEVKDHHKAPVSDSVEQKGSIEQVHQFTSRNRKSYLMIIKFNE